MRRALTILVLISCVLLLGCEQATDKADGGGVILSVSDFDGLPAEISVNAIAAAGVLTIGELTIDAIAKDPTGIVSSLMNVEMESYEVTFSRADTGLRLGLREATF